MMVVLLNLSHSHDSGSVNRSLVFLNLNKLGVIGVLLKHIVQIQLFHDLLVLLSKFVLVTNVDFLLLLNIFDSLVALGMRFLPYIIVRWSIVPLVDLMVNIHLLLFFVDIKVLLLLLVIVHIVEYFVKFFLGRHHDFSCIIFDVLIIRGFVLDLLGEISLNVIDWVLDTFH
jgi:hypothetical protein